MLAGRYRIVAPLGRGGMGEVYRADDIRLGQPVALKFLPAALAADSERLERLVDEVRIGRQISHPNVCRLYDIAEAEGHHFLVMEYVDGEDLASLLRRIGRLPGDKALEVARGVCAGLAAAHDKGVIHRDLKPANVMIDGRGHARIADFGLAALAGGGGAADMSGTPAYMAPEQLTGGGASLRSDVYALGLVLHEMLTGKRVFEAKSLNELRSLHAETKPPSLSSATDLDPAFERVILRCLARDPNDRPATARVALASLPGGDPLQAALLAGETPSPEMVAAAGKVGDLRPAVAWACLSFVIVGIVAAGVLSRWTAYYQHVPFEEPPEVMRERAREILKLAGVVDRPADWAGWYENSGDQTSYCGRVAICYVYRQSRKLPDSRTGTPSYLEPLSGEVRRDDPPLRSPGMVKVELTTEGRLTRFSVVPPSFDDTKPGAAPPDWAPFLKEAGFDLTELLPDHAIWTPPVASDGRAAWRFTDPKRGDSAVRIEAASFRDRPVDFRIVWRWDHTEEDVPWGYYSLFYRLFVWWGMPFFGVLVVMAASVILARHNLRLGKSDVTGALRTAAFFFAARGLATLLTAHHVASPMAEARILRAPIFADLSDAVGIWLFYVALEPYARRRWPQAMISWSRLVKGRLKDPLVGRDILVGAMSGTATGLLWHLSYFAPSALGLPRPHPFSGGLWDLNGLRLIVGDLLDLLAAGVELALTALLLLTLYRMVLRKEGPAIVALVITFVVFNLWWVSGHPIELFFLTLIFAMFVFTLVRFGLLALASAGLFLFALRSLPIALDFGAWYAGHALLAVALLALPAVYAFHVSLAGRPAFGRLLED